MYTNWIDLVEINKDVKKSQQQVQDQNVSLEKRNHELLAQIKAVTGRLNGAESRMTRMSTGKAKLDEILEAGRRAELKTDLGYAGGNHTQAEH